MKIFASALLNILLMIGAWGVADGQQGPSVFMYANRDTALATAAGSSDVSTRPGAPVASVAARPQSLQKTNVALPASFIVKIESGNIVTGHKYGHGICLDFPCVHVLTNYHVAGLLGRAKVEGVAIEAARYATGPDDPKAVPIKALGSVYSFDPQEDIALLTLKRALPRKFTAAQFAEEEPRPGMDVVRYPATLETYRGTLTNIGPLRYLDANSKPREMESALLTDFDSPLGVSGGALCDGQGRVIGLTELHNRSIAIPLPVVSAFLKSVDPALWARLGLEKVATTTDATESNAELPTVIFEMPDDPDSAVSALIVRASEMREQMTRVVANSEIRRSGPGVKAQPERYEIALFGSGVRFRRILPSGQLGAETTEPPIPSYGITPSADWDYLLAGLFDASIAYLGETLYNGEIAHVFSFSRMFCPFRERRPTGTWAGNVVCEGQVLTDGTFHPLSIEAAFSFEPSSILSRLRMDVRFQLFNLPNGSSVYLPENVQIKAKYKHAFGTYGASNSFADYRLFQADHVIHADVAGGSD